MSFQSCPYCGTSLANVSAKYCFSCGRPLYSTAPDGSPASPRPPTSERTVPSVSQPTYARDAGGKPGSVYEAVDPGPGEASARSQSPIWSPSLTQGTIRSSVSTTIFLLAVGMTLAAALIVGVDVAYQLTHFDQLSANLPTWVVASLPVASFLALVALALHAVAARLRTRLQQRLEAMYGASGMAVALADLPAWLRWLWPSRQKPTAGIFGLGRATSTAGQIVSFGLTGALLLSSVGVTVATPHHLYLPEHRLPAGTLTAFVGSATEKGSPDHLIAGPDGNLWFAGGDFIGRVTPDGVESRFRLPSIGGTSSVMLGPDGNLWFMSQNYQTDAVKIGRMTPTGALSLFPLPAGSGTPGDSDPLVSGRDGNLWFILASPAQVGRITPAGRISLFPLPPGSTNPGSIAVGPDGNVWFAEWAANQIGRITPAGVITEFPIPFGGGPVCLTAGPDGNLWFIDDSNSAAEQIGRITPGGVITLFTVANAAFYAGSQLVVGPDHNLWFLDDSKVGRITTSGNIREFSLPRGGQAWGGQYAHVTVGPDGNLWFPVTDPGRIDRITPAGTLTEFPLPSAISTPSVLTVGSDDNLWFTEYDFAHTATPLHPAGDQPGWKFGRISP